VNGLGGQAVAAEASRAFYSHWIAFQIRRLSQFVGDRPSHFVRVSAPNEMRALMAGQSTNVESMIQRLGLRAQ
jgi:hypothetical protein